MKKTLTFNVTVELDDHGEADSGTIRDGILMGIDMAVKEGWLSRVDDTSTVISGYTCTHSSTVQSV